MGGYVSIANEAASEFKTGHGTVGTTPVVALITVETPVKKYVEVKADLTNTNNIFVGINTVSTTTGFLLDAGESVRIPIDDLSKVYVVADAAAQGFSWLAV